MLRRSTLCVAITSAFAIGATAAAGQVTGGPSEITARGSNDPLAANQWARWSPGRVGPASSVSRSRRGGLVLKIGPGRRTRTAYYRLVLPASTAAGIGIRLSYTTPDSTAFLAVGNPRHRIWKSRANRTVRNIGVRRSLKGRRIIYVGLVRRGSARPKRGTAQLRVSAYRLASRGQRITVPPSPKGTTVGAAPVAGPRPSGPQILWGARIGGSTYGSLGDAPYDMRALEAFERNAGKTPSLVLWGQAWYDGGRPQRFQPALLSAVRQRGAIPVLDWSPSNLASGAYRDQPDFQFSDILAGRYDAYIREWATAAAAWGHPFFLRFCHEMNGTWFPWSERTNGNSPGEFVRVWRHVHDIFTSVGADNVWWIWSPNEISGGRWYIDGLYPGSAYVDWTGMSGYSWGYPPYRSFDRIFGDTYRTILNIAPTKPMMVTEVGASENNGSKAAWLTDMLTVELPQRYTKVKGLVYWNRNESEDNWPIESSPSATAAFAAGIASQFYAPAEFSGVAANFVPTR
jgi:hypothetical protein